MVRKRILDNIYEEEYRNCEVCNSNNIEIIFEKPSWGEKNHVYLIDKNKKHYHKTDVICKECGLIYKNPMLAEKSLNKFYKKDYQGLYHPGMEGGISKKFLAESFITSTYFMDFLKSIKYDLINKDVLEIGCGYGVMSWIFKINGANIDSIDYSKRAAEVGNKLFGLDIQCEDLFEKEFKNKKYDLICILNTLEHMYSPCKVLMYIKSLLKPDGKIIIEVPSSLYPYYNADINAFLSSAHTFTFNANNISYLFKKCGYNVEKISYKGHQGCMIVVANINEDLNFSSELLIKPDIFILKSMYKEIDSIPINFKKITEELNKTKNFSEVGEKIHKFKYISNVLMINIGLQLLSFANKNEINQIVRDYNFSQVENNLINYGAFLEIKGLLELIEGNYKKAYSIFIESFKYFPNFWEYNFIKESIIEGVCSLSILSLFSPYFRVVNYLNLLRKNYINVL